MTAKIRMEWTGGNGKHPKSVLVKLQLTKAMSRLALEKLETTLDMTKLSGLKREEIMNKLRSSLQASWSKVRKSVQGNHWPCKG